MAELDSYLQIKHPQWRVAEWDLLAREVKVGFFSSLQLLVSGFPQLVEFVTDIEIVGSYALGNAEIYSDLDVNLAGQDWVAQQELMGLFMDRNFAREFLLAIIQIRETFQINFEVAARTPNNKSTSVPVWSVNDRAWHNKAVGQRFPHTLKWNRTAHAFIPATKETKSFSIDEDPFAREVPEWAERYGADFQWLR